jgi:hypothetical protein
VAHQPLSIDEEGRRPGNSGLLGTRDVLEDALSKAALAKGRLDLLRVQREPPRHR